MRNLILTVFAIAAFLDAGKALSQKLETRFQPNLDVHFMPIALAFPDPSIRIGSEYMTGGRWSYGLSLGVGMRPLSHSLLFQYGKTTRPYNMVEVRPEVKFYWLKRDYMGWYAAAEGVISHVNRKLYKDSHYLTETTEVRFDRASFNKGKIGLIGKIGIKILVPKKLTIDMYTGLGLAHTNVRYTNLENPEVLSYDAFFQGENFFPGKKITPIVSFGIKFGLLVWQGQK